MGNQANVHFGIRNRTRTSGQRVGDRLPTAMLWVGLAFMAILGAVWSRDYGVSWDVAASMKLGRATLGSYRELRPPTEADQLQDLARHGPWGVTITEWVTTWISRYWPDRAVYQVHYFVHFLWFTFGAGVVFALARRWVKPVPALIASALWSSQPLLFGHGFINPFDGSFVTIFAAAGLAGYTYADVLAEHTMPGPPPAWRDVRSDWTHASVAHRLAILAWLGLVMAVVVDTLFSHRIVLPFSESAVREALSGIAWSPAIALSRQWRWVAILALGLFGFYLFPRVFPRTFFPSKDLRSVASAALAGSVLGLAFASRLIAPIAGLMVSLLVLGRSKYRGVQSLLVYWVAAAVVGYAAWPSLWSSPLATLKEFLRYTTLTSFDIPVLFAGVVSRAADLPRTYLPTFVLLQTTLPALALAGFGVYLGLSRKDSRRPEYLVTCLWFALPMVLAIALGTTLYDNGRHYLFMWTAGFLYAAVTLEWLLACRVPSAAKVAIVVAILLPGIVGILRLHPYEYVYFNELSGGVRGAVRRYELDYWATSYREAMDYVNREASPGAWIALALPRGRFYDYARGDLHLAPADYDRARGPELEFAVATTRANGDLGFFPEAPIVFRVEVNGATLAVVRDLR
ncbi:MAG: hypothetical protein HW375_321 [Anaerolineales bacterium]|nr:hypothetical protein [Anaerolineales bacterium]